MLFATLARSFAPVPPLPATARQCRWLRGKPHKLAGKHALGCPITGLRRHWPATLPSGSAGWNRHKSASKVSAPADIQGGDVVADERPSGLSDALSVRTEVLFEPVGPQIRPRLSRHS